MTASAPRFDAGRAAWALPFTVLALSTVAVLALAAAPSRADAMAAVYPPWWTSARAVASAATEGRLQAVGSANVVVVTSDQPALGRRLRASGALFVIDSRLASLCVPPQSLASSRDPA